MAGNSEWDVLKYLSFFAKGKLITKTYMSQNKLRFFLNWKSVHNLSCTVKAIAFTTCAWLESCTHFVFNLHTKPIQGKKIRKSYAGQFSVKLEKLHSETILVPFWPENLKAKEFTKKSCTKKSLNSILILYALLYVTSSKIPEKFHRLIFEKSWKTSWVPFSPKI